MNWDVKTALEQNDLDLDLCKLELSPLPPQSKLGLPGNQWEGWWWKMIGHRHADITSCKNPDVTMGSLETTAAASPYCNAGTSICARRDIITQWQ